MKTLHVKTTRSLGLLSPSATLIAVLASALLLGASPAQANETVVWHRQALGQTFYCLNGSPWYWPNNDNWSQSQVMGNPCSEGTVVTQPSNWSATNYPNGANYDVILGSLGGAPANLDVGVTLNSLTIQSDGGLNMQWGSSITAAAFDLQGDGGITLGGGGGADPTLILAQDGSLTKSAGAGTFAFDPATVLRSSSGTFSVSSGTLALPGGASTYSNCTFNAVSGTTLNLVPPGQNAYFYGVVLGNGGGTLLLNGGNLNAGDGGVALNLPGSLFQWTGGNLIGVRNAGTITVATVGGVNIGGTINNEGTLKLTSTAGLNEPYGSGFNNLSTGTIEFQTDAGFSIGGGGGGNPYLSNWGLVRKSGGTNTTTIASLFNNQGGTIQVDSGTLMLSGGGSSSNGTFIVAAGGALDLTGGVFPTWVGQMTGSGAGQVLLSGGTINTDAGLTLNFPAGMFQWTYGWLSGTTINSNVVTIGGSGWVYVGGGFYNHGLVHHTSTATLGIRSSAHFENQAGSTYNLEGDGGVAPGGGGGGNPYFQNFGLLRKSSGSGVSTFSLLFNNQQGTIEVDTGTLSLAGGGSSSNGTFIVASGAVLDLTGGSGATWAGEVRGSGAGQVLLSGGTINTDPGLTLNLPGSLFQWTGGWLSGTTINSNVVAIAGSNSVLVAGVFYNSGLVRHTNTATLAIRNGAHFENQAGGTYDLEGDGGIVNGGWGGASPYFQNSGLLRKSGGNGTSTISIDFFNQNGSIEVDGGTLSVGAYSQGNGALTIKLGGRGAGQFGQLVVGGSASLGGPLNVSLVNGFAPAPGDSFQILSCGSRSGVFSTLNVPAGLSVNYGNNGVSLVVTGAVPVQIVGPALSGGNLIFSFGTVTNQSYTIQYNDDLSTNDWRYYTNLTGDGAQKQITTPVTGSAHRFFRVRQP